MRLPLLVLLTLFGAGPLGGRGPGTGAGGAPVARDGPAPAEVNRAVDEGLAWFLERQRPEGAFALAERPGRTALIAYTLLKGGLPAGHHAVRRALAHAQAGLTPTTYDVACLCLALAAAHAGDPRSVAEGGPGFLADLEGPAALLAELQGEGGAWGYPDGEDLSNTQYAALGLWAARRAGVRVDEDVWLRLAEAVLAFHTREGGFTYRRGGGDPTGSMTAAGVGTLAICLEYLGDGSAARRRRARYTEALEHGLEWLGRTFDPEANPGSGAWLHYYLYGLERVGALTSRERLGGHDWYAEGARRLLRTRNPGGTWGSPEDTAFALLFLRRATAPRTGETRDDPGARRDLREGDVHLVRVGDDPLRAWIAGWDPEVRRTHEWPGEEGRGPHVAHVTWLVDGHPAQVLAGDPERPAGQDRFPLEHRFREPGVHRLAVEVTVHGPPYTDSFGRTRPGPQSRVRSGELELRVDAVCPQWMLEVARDPSRDLLPAAGPSARASSSAARSEPERAVDGDLLRGWLCAPGDPTPWLRVDLAQPVRADTVVVGHALTWPHRPGALGRALEVGVSVNGADPLVLRMPADERRPGRLTLPREMEVRTLTLTFPWRVPSDAGGDAVGVNEVGLQRRGRARPKDEERGRR